MNCYFMYWPHWCKTRVPSTQAYLFTRKKRVYQRVVLSELKHFISNHFGQIESKELISPILIPSSESYLLYILYKSFDNIRQFAFCSQERPVRTSENVDSVARKPTGQVEVDRHPVGRNRKRSEHQTSSCYLTCQKWKIVSMPHVFYYVSIFILFYFIFYYSYSLLLVKIV